MVNINTSLQANHYRHKATLHQRRCLDEAERIARRDNAGAEGLISADTSPELGKVQISTAGPSYSLEYKPEAGKPPFWKFWKKVEPHFEHGDVKDLRDTTSWEGVTIETQDDGSVSYQKKGLSIIGDEWFYSKENSVADSQGRVESYSYREKALGNFRGGPIPDFEESDHHEEFAFNPSN